MVQYTCPKCGGDLQKLILCSNPPQEQLKCFSCGWEYTKPQQPVIKIPFVPESQSDYIPSPCKTCSNHPSNGGSGICDCILGTPIVY